jgi:predicted transposase YdaD
MLGLFEKIENEAFEKGEKIGEKRGEKIGEKIGEKRGEKIERERNKRAVVERALEKSYSLDLICDLLDLPLDEVKKIQTEIENNKN